MGEKFGQNWALYLDPKMKRISSEVRNGDSIQKHEFELHARKAGKILP